MGPNLQVRGRQRRSRGLLLSACWSKALPCRRRRFGSRCRRLPNPILSLLGRSRRGCSRELRQWRGGGLGLRRRQRKIRSRLSRCRWLVGICMLAILKAIVSSFKSKYRTCLRDSMQWVRNMYRTQLTYRLNSCLYPNAPKISSSASAIVSRIACSPFCAKTDVTWSFPSSTVCLLPPVEMTDAFLCSAMICAVPSLQLTSKRE